MAARVAPSAALATLASPAQPRHSATRSVDERSAALPAPSTPPLRALSPPSRPAPAPSSANSARSPPPAKPAKPAQPASRPAQHRSQVSASGTPLSPLSPATPSATTPTRQRSSAADEPNTPNSDRRRAAKQAGGAGGGGGGVVAGSTGSRYEKTKTVAALNREREDRDTREKEQREKGEREKRERERREREDARRVYDEATRVKQLAPPTALPAAGRPRARLIDRKPNLHVTTGSRAAMRSSDNSPVTAGTRKSGRPAAAKPRAMHSKKAPTAAQAQPVSDAPMAKVLTPHQTAERKGDGLPGAVNADALAGVDVSHSGHDRHTSIMPGALPTLASRSTSDTEGSPGHTKASSSSSLATDPTAAASGLSDHTLLLASTFLYNANHFLSAQHRTDLSSLRLYHAHRLLPARLLVFCVILLNMLLSYLEEKATLHMGGLLALEFLLLTALGCWTALELYLYPHRMKQSKSRWLVWDLPWFKATRKRITIPIWRDKWDQGKCVILAICFLDWLVSAAGGSSYRVAKPLRAYFLITYSHDTRAQTRQVFSTIQAMFIPFVMVLLLVFFETVMSMIFFHTTDSSTTGYFNTLHDSFISIFAVATTANFPDIAFQAIDLYGLASVFFFMFCLSIGLYVTVSLLIAFVYTTWREQAVGEYWNKLRNRETNLKNAYTLLVAGSVDKWKDDRVKEKLVRDKERADRDKAFHKTWKELTKGGDAGSGAAEDSKAQAGRSSRDSINAADTSTNAESDEAGGEKLLSLTAWSHLFAFMHPKLATDESQILSRVFFLLLTTTSTQECSQQDFLDLCEHLQSLTSLTSKDALPQKTPLALRLQAVFEHRYAQYARSGLVVLQVLMVAEYFQTATTSDDMYSPVWPFALDCLYAAWLCIEILLSIYINTWPRYIASPWKRASFIIAALSISGKILLELVIQPALHDPTLALYRAVMFFRLVRVLRVPLIIKRFRLGLKSLVRVFLPLMELFIYLIVIYYLWAVLGEVCFGQLLDPTHPPEAILELDFYKSGYYRYFHFNDFSTSLFTLFHFMAVTNWHWTVGALMAVSSQAAFLYYLSFYFIVSICSINLVIAYLVETLEIAVKNLSIQRADKDADRRQRREAELWAKEMIELERDEAAVAAHRRASQDERFEEGGLRGDEHGAGDPDGGGAMAAVLRTVSAAPTIEKRKKRVGVFEEDALKHAELNKGKLAEENEESLSRVGDRDSQSQYAGIDEELGTTASAHDSDAPDTPAAEAAEAAADSEAHVKADEEHKEPPKASPKSTHVKGAGEDVPHSPLVRHDVKSHLHGHKMASPMGSPRASVVVSRANQSAMSPSTAGPLPPNFAAGSPAPLSPAHGSTLISTRPASAAPDSSNLPQSVPSPQPAALVSKATIVDSVNRTPTKAADTFKPPPPVVVKRELTTMPKLKPISPQPVNHSAEPGSGGKQASKKGGASKAVDKPKL